MQFNRCFGCMEETSFYPCPYCGFDPRTAPAYDYALAWGTVLDCRYVLGRMLGRGVFGVTYIGYDLSLQRKVAIKEFCPLECACRLAPTSRSLHWASDAVSQELRTAGMDSFLREAQETAKVENIPEVVGVRECFRENGTAYIVMDYVEGELLPSVLKEKGPMSWEQAKKIFFPAISAMEKVHRAGLVHRDFNPDNLMLTAKGVRILELGTGKSLSSYLSGDYGVMICDSPFSDPGLFSARFSPPEKYLRRGVVGPWSDVYAMAATMYYTLTGVRPPSGIDRVYEDTLDWKLLSRRGIPGHVVSALQKAMAVTAKGRTQSMAELLSQLQQGSALGNQPVPVHVMAAEADGLPLANLGERENQPFWGQTAYKRGEVKTVTFRGFLEGVPADAQDVSAAGDRSILAWMEDGNLTVAADGKIAPNPNACWMFSYFVNATEIDFGECFDTSNVTNMGGMFQDCRSLTGLDVSGFDTANATNMAGMFQNCSSLTDLDVSGFDISNVTNMVGMFSGCSSLTKLDVSGFDTANVTNMVWMFADCSSLKELDVSGFDTAMVTDMAYMFYYCVSLTDLDVSGFDTSNVTDMCWMFANCSSLKELDVSGFDSSKVTNMAYMFSGCTMLNDFKCTDQRIRGAYDQRSVGFFFTLP